MSEENKFSRAENLFKIYKLIYFSKISYDSLKINIFQINLLKIITRLQDVKTHFYYFSSKTQIKEEEVILPSIFCSLILLMFDTKETPSQHHVFNGILVFNVHKSCFQCADKSFLLCVL